ncbi:MAG: xanthine dehydrogenase family protein molybdopterin-binding subunit, partial [Gemmatimonadales bacterium]|nr:xanthine dehydrogenase family protein molybdopterin-binding subunit [Gemmatimonadales bacterium]
MASIDVTRRDFLKVSGGVGTGLVLAFYLPGCRPMAATSLDTFEPNAWIGIGTDGIVTLTIDKSEMGQGTHTALAMILAEELEADWSMVRLEVPVDPSSWERNMGTGGSTSVRGSYDLLRKAGATGREMLITAAAETWGVERSECRAERGEVVHTASNRRLGYGALAERAAALKAPADPLLKDPKDFTILGTEVKRLDIPSKVDGSAVFGIDVRVPGVLIASVERSRVFGGRVTGCDAAAAMAVEGVRHVVEVESTVGARTDGSWPARLESGVAVVADTYWQAITGRSALKTTWDEGANADLGSDAITQQFQSLAAEEGKPARNEGDAIRALSRTTRTIDAVYQVPYLHHATMEPMNCTAHVRAGECDIWAPTQTQSAAQTAVARALGVRPGKVRIHTTFLGGGFGRRLEPDYAAEAAVISQQVGGPVKVVWSREDDTHHGFYRPATYNRFSAVLGQDGTPVAWRHHIVGPSISAEKGWLGRGEIDDSSVEGAATLPYDIPNLRVEYTRADVPVPVGFWRSVGSSQNAFVTEGFIDELAVAAGEDPFEYRRRLLSRHHRHRRVLELAAEKSGWGTPLGAGCGRGIAVAEAFGSFVAHVAEVTVDDGGQVRVDRVVCAVDCGPIVNPDTIEAQMEGGVAFGLTAALYGKISIDRGRVQQNNFHDYQMLRMREMPRVEVSIV